ncbi:response regulator [Fibrobacter sp. UWB13]|uniref:response regulator n=1 Tax=Fibrobacter sp. UWB13 TaxID=1896204 RepID=UPI000A0B04CF|nr:response regulator [Fibrobacter sp. UWB13]SMG15351.1 His Kinase A (phospho-acceptor) domain-containing protein [Fibrobacter sp. UWB13]
MVWKKRNGVKETAIGNIAMALAVIAGFIALAYIAVQNISSMFMEELAGRREQFVESKLTDYVNSLNFAVNHLTPEDLASEANFQSYQYRLKHVYGLERFAFVDSRGVIYTSNGTRDDIDLYKFDYKTLSKPEISLKKVEGEHKTIIVAIPINKLHYNGQTLVVSFMEINISRLLEGVSLQLDTNSAVSCNIYTKDGQSLLSMVLGGFASDENLFTAMEKAAFDEGYSVETIRTDFSAHQEGTATFTLNGIRETVHYIPVKSTDWMLAYLVRDNVFSEQFTAFSEGIVERNLIISVIVLFAIVLLSIFFIVQTRRNAKYRIEQEIIEAENRVKQKKLEEQLKLQEKLVEQERQRSEQSYMINALSSEYKSVFYVDLENDTSICYRKVMDEDIPFDIGEKIQYWKIFSTYAKMFILPEYQEKFIEFIKPEHIREALQKETLISLRYKSMHKGKETYEMVRMATANTNEDGTIRIVGVGFSNIDEEMRESMAKNQTLIDALKAAEEANKAKTVFLSNMSHEIRTPMNAIIGLDNLALHEKDISPKMREYLEKIGSSAEHLLSLINEILDMSRIESGRMTIHSEEFSSAKMLEQVNTIFNGQCSERGLNYVCNISDNIDDYYIGDDMKIRQVLINILGNAVKFTPQGGSVTFSINKATTYDNKSTLVFKISDTGIGMSKEYLPKLFEPFSQEDPNTTIKYGSSGLGLAITKGIVDMMNGKIEVESEKGKGTTFTISLTLLNSDRSDKDTSDIQIQTSEMSVLVVDDDEVAMNHAKLVLEKSGISTEVANSGKEAVEMVKLRHARCNPYSLIVLDWQMHEMDGVETARQIRAVTGDDTAIIVLTAYNWDDVLDEALAAGVDCFIAKPIFTKNILDELKNILKKKRQHIAPMKKKAELSGRQLLLAEDMEVNAQIMIEILKMRNIQTDHAENGKIALEMFSKSPIGYYDAILMDMRMPEMDGLEATAAIRKLDRPDAKVIPIIALTANAFDEDVQRSLQAGLNAHLSKPVQPDVLFETLEGML